MNALIDLSTNEKLIIFIKIPIPNYWHYWLEANGLKVISRYKRTSTKKLDTVIEGKKNEDNEKCIEHLKMLLEGYTIESSFPCEVWSCCEVPEIYHPPVKTTLPIPF